MCQTMEYYDKTAAQWAGQGYAPDAALTCLKDFLKPLPKGARVLDLCCNAGYETARIAAAGYQALGVDFSRESLKIARKKNPSLPFYEADMLGDYSHIGTVDAITVIAGLVHIETSKLPLAFKQMNKVLKENGRILLSIREGVGKMEKQSLCTVDETQYDRNFIAHTLKELQEAAKGLFSYECELASDMQVWKNYVFVKKGADVREMHLSDLPAVVPLYLSQYNGEEGGCWTWGRAEKRIRQILSMEDSFSLLLEDNHCAIGFAMGYFRQYDDITCYYLDEILIAPAYQNKGIGSVFLEKLENLVRQKGASCVELQAVNDASHERYYQKAGYHDAKNFVMKVKWF